MARARWLSTLLGLVLLPGCGRGPSRHPPVTGPAPAMGFTDHSLAAGLRFRHRSGAAGEFLFPEPFGAGGAFLDYNRDGWLDLFLVNSGDLPGARQPSRATSALYRGNQDGTFTDVTRAAGLAVPFYGMGAAAADYDNDGYPDLYVTAAFGESRLFHNQRSGAFREVARAAGVANAGRWGTSCAWLDYDLDGRLDLFVCNYVRYRSDEERVCRAGDQRVYCGPLVYPADSCRLFHNLGGGRFRDVTASAGVGLATGKSLGVAVWDFDGDRFPEIVVANDLTPNYLFRNRGDGTFREVGAEAGIAYGGDGTARSGMGIDVADPGSNGTPAILVSNFAREPNSYFVSQGHFLFSDRTDAAGLGPVSLPFLGFGLFFFDYDNDGGRDAFIANGHIQPAVARTEPPLTYAQRPLLFHNRRDGTFEEVGARLGGPLARPVVGRGAASGDYDNDGDVDVLVTTNDGPAQLLRNDGGGRHWLQVELEGGARPEALGRVSNRDGLGALVLVESGGETQRDTVRTGSSYLSQSMLRLHFGLGEAARVDRVEVRWPSGIVDRLTGVAADQRLRIREGETRPTATPAATPGAPPAT